MLQEIQEMGSHAKDIYDFLLSGLGRFSFCLFFLNTEKIQTCVCLSKYISPFPL